MSSTRAEAGSLEESSVSVQHALESFRAIRSRTLRWSLWLLPGLIAVFLGLVGFAILTDPIKSQYTSGKYTYEIWCRATLVGDKRVLSGPCIDGQYASGAATAGLVLILFQLLMNYLPKVLATLWERNLIALAPQSEGASTVSSAYSAYIRDLDRWLNHAGQWVVGVSFGFLGVLWRVVTKEPAEPFVLGVELLLGVVIGQMAWRSIILGIQVRELAHRFVLTPKLLHPDQCGGFKPLGDLELWNALLILIPAILFTFWSILLPESQSYVAVYLLVLVPLGILTFFLPLWRVHEAMLAQHAFVSKQLQEINENIDRLARTILTQTDVADFDKREKTAKQVALMRQVYQDHANVPVWPFDTGILVRFLGSLIIPVLGLVKTPSAVMEVVKAVLSALK